MFLNAINNRQCAEVIQFPKPHSFGMARRSRVPSKRRSSVRSVQSALFVSTIGFQRRWQCRMTSSVVCQVEHQTMLQVSRHQMTRILRVVQHRYISTQMATNTSTHKERLIIRDLVFVYIFLNLIMRRRNAWMKRDKSSEIFRVSWGAAP